MGHQNRALGGRRLAEMPAILGGSGLASAEGDNPYPHPFP
jgi:ribosomal protein S12 methylthiotransferase accessory factor